MRLVDRVLNTSLRKDIPSINIGDTVNLHLKIVESGKEKLQAFKGVVIAKSGGGPSETFVVRKISYGEGVERTFFLNSPRISSLEVIKKGRIRRAKLYYLRNKIGKKAKIRDLEKETIVPQEGVVEEAVAKDITEKAEKK